jgi:hypothetical protein
MNFSLYEEQENHVFRVKNCPAFLFNKDKIRSTEVAYLYNHNKAQ